MDLEIGFNLPELVVESIIRDGIQNVRLDNTIIDNVFNQLLRNYAKTKYGAAEIAKIKTLMNTKEIAVIYSYHEVDAKSPCFSIMIGSDNEQKDKTQLNDYEGGASEEITDSAELAALIRVSNVIVTSYDPISGRILVDDSVDLSEIYKGMIFVDADDVEHVILGGIDTTLGSKSFFIGKNDDVDISAPGLIKSSLATKEYEVKVVRASINLVIGVHTKDALTTKYLYLLLKYFLLSRKTDLIKRGIIVSSYSGSDFNRDSAYSGDQVFTRFLTMTGMIDDSWRADQVVQIDNVVVNPIPIE